MTKDIESFLLENEKKQQYNFEELNTEEIGKYYQNAKADSIYCYSVIKKYLTKDKKVLEVGGGIHLLTSFLSKNYDITSIEPGGFTGYTDILRNKIIKNNNINVITSKLENFETDSKFDFIFSMNVLEHTDDIEHHLKCCMNLLKDQNSILFIQCPNYTFPFECHFYRWFIPFMPKFTFKYLRKKKLINELGKEKYNNILNFLNFDCTYFNIKKLNLPLQFEHPLKDIFDRLDTDRIFRERLFINPIIKIAYYLIDFLKIKKIITTFFPKFLCPYLILKIIKK